MVLQGVGGKAGLQRGPSLKRYGVDDGVCLRVIAGRLASMDKHSSSARCHDKDATLLKGVSLGSRLPVTGTVGPNSRCQHPHGLQASHASAEVERSVGCSVGVGQEKNGLRVGLCKGLQEGHSAISYDNGACPSTANFRLCLQDVSNLLTTE